MTVKSGMAPAERRRRLATAYRLILSWGDGKETAERGKVEGQTHSAAGDADHESRRQSHDTPVLAVAQV